MSLVTIVITLALAGLFVWAVTTYIPMDPKFASLIRVVAIVAALLWLLSVFGIYDVRPVKFR